MSLKYRLLDHDRFQVGGHVLYRIQALKDFGYIEAGDLGGYIAGYHNLAHEGECWVYPNSCVYQCARVEKNARLLNGARALGNTRITDNALVDGDARVRDNAYIGGNSKLIGESSVNDNAKLLENAYIKNSIISDYAVVRGNASVLYTLVYEEAIVQGDTELRKAMSGYGDVELNLDYMQYKKEMYQAELAWEEQRAREEKEKDEPKLKWWQKLWLFQ